MSTTLSSVATLPLDDQLPHGGSDGFFVAQRVATRAREPFRAGVHAAHNAKVATEVRFLCWGFSGELKSYRQAA
jgi:hypothetical protein